MKSIKNANVKDKRVLVRCDFNVPLDEEGNIAEDFRIRQTLPTLKYLQENGARLILASHFADDKSLAPVWKKVKELIGEKNITFLENLRFNKGEEDNSESFAKELANSADIYVNDAFGVCHRNHASVVKITNFLPSYAGLLLEKEVNVLAEIMQSPKRPLVAIIGGVKFESKAKIIDKFIETADHVLVGGKIGLSQEIKKLNSSKLVLPMDDIEGFDIGNKSIKLFVDKIKRAKTIIWAGPVGLFEKEPYDKGTKAVGEAILKNKSAFKVAGGGDTIAAVFKFNFENGFNHLSTGGGAMLDFLAGKDLPGLKALENNEK